MSVNLFSSGNVYEVYEGQVDKFDGSGDKVKMVSLKFTAPDRVRENGQYVTKTVVFGQVSAYDRQAESWLKNFPKGAAIEVQGKFHTETFTRKDGTVAVTHVYANGAIVNFCPRTKAGDETSQVPAQESEEGVVDF